MMSLYDDLIHHTQADVDRHGEAHLTCPECSHASSPRHPHCSFNQTGWHCFVCGAGGSLADLARRVDFGDRLYNAPVRLQKAPTAPATWLSYADDLVERYESHANRYQLWSAYKPLSRATIQRMRLGVGVLPASRCRHERLILPVIDGSMIVALRGRAISCDCGKWLAAGGTTLDMLPLYNSPPPAGSVIWIVENPVDALLLSERTPYHALATYSVSYWRDAWSQALVAACPKVVVVAFDNDLPGNGGAANRPDFVRQWLASHPRIPQPNGVQLVNRLLRLGLPAVLYDWGRSPNKADIGNLLSQGAIHA